MSNINIASFSSKPVFPSMDFGVTLLNSCNALLESSGVAPSPPASLNNTDGAGRVRVNLRETVSPVCIQGMLGINDDGEDDRCRKRAHAYMHPIERGLSTAVQL